MREISQAEAEAMRNALKEIAKYHNDGIDQSNPGQAAARRARTVLDEFDLYDDADAGSGEHGN